ncbi:MAG: hypothetical protein GX945_14420 [Lentisphaerae bacterium]|nr:hypothetical protein [Lentisphaerota bacterium]
MSRKCDILREKAMRGGEGSPAEAAWKRHGRECPDCHAEIYVLDTLRRQALNERMHLPRKDMAMLVDVVRQQYRQPREERSGFWHTTWQLSWKAAALAVLVFSLLQVIPGEWASNLARDDAPTAQFAADDILGEQNGLMASADSGNYFVPLSAGVSELEMALLSATSPKDAACLPEVLPGQSIDRAIRQARKDVTQQRLKVMTRIERDMRALP